MKKSVMLVLYMVFSFIGVSDATVLLHYTFDGISGSMVDDTGASGLYDGTLDCYQPSGTTGSYTAGLTGKYGDAVQFTSSNGSTAGGWSLASEPVIALPSSFTVSFWVNTSRWTNSAWVTYADSSTDMKFIIYAHNESSGVQGITARMYDGGAITGTQVATKLAYTGNLSETSGVWHHIAAVVTECSDITLYVDGTQYLSSSTTTAGYSTGPSGYSFEGLKLGGRFGTNGTNNKYVSGLMDDFAMFDTAFSAAQVAALYNSQFAIPEPAAMTMLALGLAAVCRRTKK